MSQTERKRVGAESRAETTEMRVSLSLQIRPPPNPAGVVRVLLLSSSYLLPNKAHLLSSPCCHNEYCSQARNDGDNHVK